MKKSYLSKRRAIQLIKFINLISKIILDGNLTSIKYSKRLFVINDSTR